MAAKTSHELPSQQRRNEESVSDPPQSHPSHDSSSQSERVRQSNSREGVRGPYGPPPGKDYDSSSYDSNRGSRKSPGADGDDGSHDRTTSAKNTGSGGYAAGSTSGQRGVSGSKYGSTSGVYGSGGSRSSSNRDRDSDDSHKHDNSGSMTERVQQAFSNVKDKVEDALGTGHSSTSQIASQQSGGAQHTASPSNPSKPPQKKTPTTIKNK